jgi:chemotaxis signal transduction protein
MREENLATVPTARLLVFRVGVLSCAAEVDQVREILPRLPTTRIPGAPPVVAGLVNVRGTLVTVVEGWRALGQEPPTTPPLPDAAAGSTIILELESPSPADGANESRKLIGFTVDEVVDMLAVGDTALEHRESLPGVDPTLVKAVGRREAGEAAGNLFIVLNVAALLGPVLTN